MPNPNNLPYDKTAPWYQYHRLMAQGKNGMHLEWTCDPGFGHGWIMVMELDPSHKNGQPSLEQQQAIIWFDELADFDETEYNPWPVEDFLVDPPTDLYGMGQDLH